MVNFIPRSLQRFLEIGKYAAIIIRVSRLVVFLSPFTEASFDESARKGTKRKHWTELVTAQGKGKGTFVNFVRTSRRELFLEIGKYEDKLFDELLNEHRRSLLRSTSVFTNGRTRLCTARVEKVVRRAT